MAGSLDVVVKFIGDSTRLQDDVHKLSKTGDSIKKWALGIGTAVGGAFAVKQIVDFGKASVDAAVESEKATARLANIFKSMGDETGQAAKAAEDYASALSLKIGVDDDAIKAGQALLATFGNVSNEAARSAGLFDRATKAGADLAAAGFGSIEGNAIQLGKALNDPIKGITALAKAGVSFTQQQKDQIKTMVETGDLLGAQNIILKEVERQVGGTAEATATGGEKMAVAFGELQESIGAAILPLVNAVMPLLTQAFAALGPVFESAIGKVQEVAATLVAWFEKNWPKIRDIAIETFERIRAFIAPILRNLVTFVRDTLLPAFSQVWDAILEAMPGVLEAFESIGNVVQKVFPVLLNIIKKLVPVISTVVSGLLKFVGVLGRNLDIVLAIAAPFAAYVATTKTLAAVQNTVKAATQAWSAAQMALNIAMSLNPIGLIVAAIVALVAIVAVLLIKFDFLETAASAVWAAMQVAWDAILGIIKAVWNWISENWPLLLAILTGPFGLAVLFIVKNWDTIKNAVKVVIDFIKNIWQGFIDWIKGAIKTVGEKINAVWQGIQTAVGTVVLGIITAWDGLLQFFKDFPGNVARAFKFLADAISLPFKQAFNFIAHIWNSTIGKLHFRIPSWVPFGLGGNEFDMPDMPELAKGGFVTQTGLAVVHRGEMFSGVGNTLGGTTYNINVAVSPGTDPAQTGRAIVDTIRAFERANGKPVLVP